MPATSSSVPPSGRSTSICSSDSGKTTHSRPRALTSDPTAKLMPTSQIYSDTRQFCLPNPPRVQNESRYIPDPPGTLYTLHHARVFRDIHDSAHRHKSRPCYLHSKNLVGFHRTQSNAARA